MPLQTTPDKKGEPCPRAVFRGVRGAKPLSKILPLPLDKGKGIQGIGLINNLY